MAVEMAIWRMTGAEPQRLGLSPLDSEQRLEDMLARDPSVIGGDLLLLGQQVRTAHGGYVDLLAIDAEGCVHVLELKRDRTPREVVAQALDYGSWAAGLSIDDLADIYAAGAGTTENAESFEQAFAEQFDCPLPDTVNEQQQFTIVASELDPTSERIVEFLAESYGVPINAVFFRHFKDEGSEYLARIWLLDPQEAEAKAARSPRSKTRPWNGRDFYVVLGKSGEDRWPLAQKYGLLNGGGGLFYWQSLKHLRPGHRVFAYVSGAGYVGIGRVVGEMTLVRDAVVTVDGQAVPFVNLPEASEGYWQWALTIDDMDLAERVVPVEWQHCIGDLDQAVWEKGLFASQHTACKLRDERTIATVEAAFGIDGAVS
ncbi:MAG: DUF91 domain-containing protein [bacterium]|nr:DUF91 domain-containing protein [bacterium]